MDNEPNFVSKILIRFALIILVILAIMFVFTSWTTGISLFNTEIIRMFVDIFGISAMTEIFWTLCLVTFAMLCTLSILGRKNTEIKKEKKLPDDKITISKEEYENMKNEIERLKKENEELKMK